MLRIKNLFGLITSFIASSYYRFLYKNGKLSAEKHNALQNELKIKMKQQKRLINNSFYSEKAYLEYILDSNKNKSQEFVKDTDDYYKNQNSVKLVSFYLPQFYEFEENNKWHEKCFTEWTNVTSAIPHFTGHYQPQLPVDIGFYDLSNIKTMNRQIEMARKYGIDAFCFHYYWFSGKRLMEKPLFNLLESKETNFPFMICWANEPWVRLWDGGDNEVLQKQELNDGDDVKFMEDILPFIKDERYIKIDGKPFIIIYRPTFFPKDKIINFIKNIRTIAKQYGFEDLYLASVRREELEGTPEDWNLDAFVEFPPHGFTNSDHKDKDDMYINPSLSTVKLVELNDNLIAENSHPKVPFKLFKGCFPAWDNTARKAYTGASIYLSSPAFYKKWLKRCIEWTKENSTGDEQVVFINAWNEWAEGAHLEPDSKYGYAYLAATKEALEETAY